MNRLYHKDTCEQTLLIKPRLNDISHIFNGFVFFNYRCVIMQNYLVFHGEVVLSVLFFPLGCNLVGNDLSELKCSHFFV